MTSMVTPPLVADVVVETGEWIVRKRRTVHGYDPTQYTTGSPLGGLQRRRALPVSVVARRDLVTPDAAAT